jgi:hypothetical protein
MTPSPVSLGFVQKGKFLPEDPHSFKKAFEIHEGKRVKVLVSRWRNERSDPQNKYYWGVVVALIGQAIGESDAQTVHETLKFQFNYEILVIGEAEIKVPRSTKKLETDKFEEYLEKIKKWASEFLELYIPDPNEAMQ